MRKRGICQVGEVDSYLVVFDVWLPREREEVLEVVKATGDTSGRLQNAIGFGFQGPVPNDFHRPIIIHPMSKNVRKIGKYCYRLCRFKLGELRL